MIVYRFTSPSGKSYVGLTKATLRQRFGQHVTSWKQLKKKGVTDYRGKKVCCMLYFAFDKYDPQTWTKEVLFETEDYDLLRQKEIEFIEQYDCIKNGYNVLVGGQTGHAGRKLSEEHKQRIRESRNKYWTTESGKKWKEQLSDRFKTDNPAKEGRIPWNKGLTYKKKKREPEDSL